MGKQVALPRKLDFTNKLALLYKHFGGEHSIILHHTSPQTYFKQLILFYAALVNVIVIYPYIAIYIPC